MKKLKVFFFVLALFSVVFLRPLSAQSYIITEEEMQQIQQNQETILKEAQALKEQSARELEALKIQSAMELAALKVKSAAELAALKEQSSKELAALNKQLAELSQSLAKSEKEKNLIIKIVIPAAAVLVTGAFCGGFYLGAQAAP